MINSKKIVAALLMLLSLIIAFAAVVISLKCTGHEVRVMADMGNPEDNAIIFMDSVCSEDYETAYSLLRTYRSLGFENEPQSEYAATIWRIIRENMSWEKSSACVQNGTEAELPVIIYYPDLSSITEGVGEEVELALAAKVEEAKVSSEIYEEDGSFKQEIVMEAYDSIMSERLADTQTGTVSTEVSLKLSYVDSQWLVAADSALLNALSGGLG